MSRKIRPAKLKIQACAWIFLCLLFNVINLSPMFASVALASNPKLTEELSVSEKQAMIKELLIEGDRYVQERNYNLANAAYESIFLLEPEHTGASQKIDKLKKQMLKEGKTETELVTRVYDSEIDMRVKTYLAQAKEYMASGQLGRARLALQKLLLINPVHQEGQTLYKQLNQELAED